MKMKLDRKAAIKKVKALVFTPKSEVAPFRAKIEKTFSSVFLPNHVECVEHNYGGVHCDVLHPVVYSSRRIIIYVHGGSFVGGSRNSYRNFCSSLAHEASCRVVVPEFRLPPSYPFPAGIEDLQAVFRMVYSEETVAMQLEHSSSGLPSALKEDVQIILAADGSGASLAIALLLKLRDKYRQCVKHLILFSPWLDVTSDNPIISGRHIGDEVISGDALHRAVDMYTYASNIDNPHVSPLKADVESFKGFPHVYIQMGQKEILLQDAERFKDILEKAGVEVTMDVWPDMMYMFQMADEYLAESHLAMEKIGKTICERAEDTEAKEEREDIMRKNNIVRDE